MARKKSDSTGIAALIVLGIVLAPFIWVYNAAGEWGILGIIGLLILLVLVWLRFTGGKSEAPRNPVQQPMSVKPYTTTYAVQSTPSGKKWSPEKTSVVRKPTPPAQAWQNTAGLGFKEIDRLISIGDWDSARTALQRIAYSMIDVDAQEKAKFTAAMSRFAELDPLFSDVLNVAIPTIEQTPGIKQADLYRGMSDDKKELIRYVLYFAAELGKIVRLKSGNSYALYPAGFTPQPKPIATKKKARHESRKASDADRRKLMRERRAQMLLNVAKRPLWQLRAVCDGRDPPGCPGVDFPVYRWDDPFWKTHGPWVCKRSECRCSVRAYQVDEEIIRPHS